ncbi:MAG: putative polymerase sigma factor [Parcubacteria group bacterium]|nr:putative polymerase sigma factor [Parcubacteria group bacterium]
MRGFGATSIMSENDLKKVREIFEKAKKGDKDAFSEMYETFFRPIYRYVYLRVGDKFESDELVQDIFLKIYNSTDGLDLTNLSDSSAIINFFAIARKSILDWNRKRRRNVMSDDKTEDYSDSKFGRTEESLKKEEFDNLREAIAEISYEEQDAIIFRFIDEFSNEDAESLLGVSARTALRLVTQGIISIRDILKKQYEQQS